MSTKIVPVSRCLAIERIIRYVQYTLYHLMGSTVICLRRPRTSTGQTADDHGAIKHSRSFTSVFIVIIVMSHVKSLALCARQGNLRGLQDAIEISSDFDVNAPISKSKDTLLHAGLSQNRIDTVHYLLENYSAIDVNVTNEQGVTPLMVAVVSCPMLIPALLKKGADPTKRNWKHRKTALDLASNETKELLEEAISKMVPTTTESSSTPCCPYCGIKLKAKTRLDFVLEAKSDNLYVNNFVATDACRIIATRPEYHVLTSKRHLKKEISESWAVLAALESMNLKTSGMVDLCAGSSLTTTMFGLMYPQSKGIAVDLMNKEFAPHLEGNLSYLQGDIMQDGFIQKLQDRLGNDAAVLVGMHLCGDLSIRAIEIFTKIPQLQAIVLSPCCFPKTGSSRMDPDSMYKLEAVKDETEKYAAWSNYLLELISKHCTNCFSKQDTGILSSRNRLVVGYR